jgi:hypothetical protein
VDQSGIAPESKKPMFRLSTTSANLFIVLEFDFQILRLGDVVVLYWHGLLVLSRKAHLPTVANSAQPVIPRLRNTSDIRR